MWWGFRACFLLAVLSVASSGCGGQKLVCLEICGQESEKPLIRLPLKPGVPFSLEFINSIYLAPVRETLLYDPSEGVSVVMVESPSDGVFEYYGLESDGTGTALMHRRVGDLKLRSHDYENHRIRIGDQTIHLKGVVPNGETLMLRVRSDEKCGNLSFSGGN